MGGERREVDGRKEAPGRHQQFRDCFSDDTLYTHGQQQPTHYGNDTCASIRINILMDREREREVEQGEGRGWTAVCERHMDETMIWVPLASVWVPRRERCALERKQREGGR